VKKGAFEDLTAGSYVIQPKNLPPLPACMITTQDFFILSEGAGSGTHRASRDVAVGVFVSCALGLIGLLMTAPDLEAVGLKGRALFFTVVLGAATLAALTIAIYHHVLSTKEKGRESYTHCVDRIRAQLK
jgi:hypothetical protein